MNLMPYNDDALDEVLRYFEELGLSEWEMCEVLDTLDNQLMTDEFTEDTFMEALEYDLDTPWLDESDAETAELELMEEFYPDLCTIVNIMNNGIIIE